MTTTSLKPTLIFWFVALLAALAWLLIIAPACADDGAKKPQPSVDDALLQDLDNDLLEGAGDLKNPAKSQPAAKDPEGTKSPAGREAEGEDIGEPGEDKDPLGRISHEMRTSEELIRKRNDRATAEQVQQQIIERLTALIDDAEKQAANQKPSSGQKKSQKTGKRQMVRQPKPAGSGRDSNKPARDSTDRMGKAEDAKPDPQRMKEMMKDSWGHLPPHAREQMSQNWPERFLPQYELMIERYYKRLAEEQSSK